MGSEMCIRDSYQTDQMAELQTSIDQLTTPDEDMGEYGPRSEYMIDEDE